LTCDNVRNFSIGLTVIMYTGRESEGLLKIILLLEREGHRLAVSYSFGRVRASGKLGKPVAFIHCNFSLASPELIFK
jgi:hypothetical protein